MSLVEKYNPMFLEIAQKGEPAFNDAEQKYGVTI
jgi:hypothetical protein